jgi:hypothetical protein
MHCAHHQQIYKWTKSFGILQRVVKYLLYMPQSPTSLQTKLVHQYFIESYKLFIAYAIITGITTDGMSPSIFSIRWELFTFYVSEVLWITDGMWIPKYAIITGITTDGMSPSIFSIRWELFTFYVSEVLWITDGMWIPKHG